MPGHYSKNKGVKIEGGGKPKFNKVWHDKGGKNFQWQPVDDPNKALTTAKSGFSRPGSKSYILGMISENTSRVREGEGTSHWMSEDYNNYMRTAAYHAMKSAYKHFYTPPVPVWEDRNRRNNKTKLNP